MRAVESVHGRRFLAHLIGTRNDSALHLSRFMRRPDRYLANHLRGRALHQLSADEIDFLARYFEVMLTCSPEM